MIGGFLFYRVFIDMKKLTERDLSRIVKKIISEMIEDSPKRLSFDEWADVWMSLRKQYGETFLNPHFNVDNSTYQIFTGMNLDFIPKNDGEYLEVMDMYRDPRNWRDDYDKGVETLMRIEDRLKERIENSDADLRFETDDNFRFRIYKN